MLVIALTLAALVAALVSGMTGLGGGTLLIGVLYAAGLAPAVAVPLHAGVQLVSNASRTLAYLPHVDWRALGVFMLGAGPAPFVLAPLVTEANADLLRLVVAGFIMLALFPASLARLRLTGRTGLFVAGLIAGGVGMVTGATGLIIAPIFLRSHWSKETVIATMALCMTAGYIVKIAAFTAVGHGLADQLDLLVPMAIAVVAGTLIGRRLVNLFSETTFRWVFRGLLILLAAKLGVDAGLGLIKG